MHVASVCELTGLRSGVVGGGGGGGGIAGIFFFVVFRWGGVGGGGGPECPLCCDEENVIRTGLKVPEMQTWKEQFINSKNFTKIPELRNLGKRLYEIRSKKENQTKTIALGIETGSVAILQIS
jgi:hypothetical protein